MSAVLAYLLVVFCGMLGAAFLTCGAGSSMLAITAAHFGMFCGML